MIQFPMRKGWKRVHRLVVLPDYQGIGVGMKFINAITDHYKENGWRVNLTTTTPALISALCRDKRWLLFRKSRVGNAMDGWNKAYSTQENFSGKRLHEKSSKNRVTYSFNYKL